MRSAKKILTVTPKIKSRLKNILSCESEIKLIIKTINAIIKIQNKEPGEKTLNTPKNNPMLIIVSKGFFLRVYIKEFLPNPNNLFFYP